jgi:ribosomal protein L9
MSSRKNQYQLSTASFVPPASPTATCSQPLSWFVQTTPQQPPTSSSTAASSPPSRASTPILGAALHAKKKGGAGGAAAASTTATKKIQVKLLKHVAGTGQAGEVILVTPAFYNNKLRPTKSAQLISNDEVQRELAARQKEQAEMQARAMAIKELLEIENSDDTAPFLKIARKAGPGGQLFGGIGAKCLVQELQNRLEQDELLDEDLREFLKSKGIKITSIVQAKTDEALPGDIKQTGDYSATIALATGESAKFDISVTAEE